MGVIDTLATKTFKVEGGNIDPRYFVYNGDGTYGVTPTFIYNVTRDAEKFYHDQICVLDASGQYHTEKTKVCEDTWSDKKKKDQLELKYGPQLKELEKRKREWREANPDKCTVYAGGPDLGDIDELRYFHGYSPEVKPSLNEALGIYMALKAFNKDDSLKASLPQKPDTLRVMKDFSAEYDALIHKWVEELGIDSDLYFQSFDKIERVVPKMLATNTKVMKAIAPNDAGLDAYIEGAIKYLTTTNKVDFKAQREECITFIDKDFVVTLGEKVKHLKAESVSPTESTDAVDEVNIYTKSDEDTDAVKFITISRENPTDAYKFVLNIHTADDDLRFAKTINVKADLRKAIVQVLTMLDGVKEFEKYIPDIETLRDTI
jgi:hypothetical protein